MAILADKLFFAQALLARLSGPLVSKELRVAGRRRRNHALRFAYVIMLTVFIGATWVSLARIQGVGPFVQAQMEAAAKHISRGIVWFQFIAVQVVALLTVSAAISDEVYSRTLAVLMTTPMSGFGLVMGKLASRLVQVLLLVATSLPLLAVVRVLGGVPWDYLLVSLVITLATVIFIATAGLYFSTLCRQAYVAVVVAAVGIGVLLGVIPSVAYLLLCRGRPPEQALLILSYVNPYALLGRCTAYMMSPLATAGVPRSSIISCCVFMVVGSGFFLRASVRLVRQVALRRAMGQPTFIDLLNPKRWIGPLSFGRGKGPAKRIRRVVGQPMVWKEMTCSLPRRQKLASRSVLGAEVFLIGVAYLFPPLTSAIGYETTHLLFVWTFLALGTLFTIAVSATLISAERESGAWSLLLVTPLSDREIIEGKYAGILRRCGPIWLPLFAYLVAFTLAGCLEPQAIIQMAIIVLSSIVLLSATGFYFGSRFDRTGDAVTGNLILAIVLWCVAPVFAQLVAALFANAWSHGQFFASVPFLQVSLVMDGALHGGQSDIWHFGRRWSDGDVSIWILIFLVVYMFVARLFLWRAVRAFRRRIL